MEVREGDGLAGMGIRVPQFYLICKCSWAVTEDIVMFSESFFFFFQAYSGSNDPNAPRDCG